MAETKTVAELKKEIEDLKSKLSIKESKEALVDEGVRRNEEYMKEPVTIKLFKDNGKYKDDVYVCVNDKSYLIRRGVEVTVPRFIEQTLKNSLSQDEYVASLVERLSTDYEKSSLGR
jgi:hypothetical protein